ncbi:MULTISPECIES: flavodoxin [Clostridia]|uniref:Flavodoxin n=1 Tax=Ruminococcus hominis TaxID=2763065 RepID=A0ABR7G811_9FIRM|nr:MULTISPECIES: flavodoxin [Clostridia]MBC5683577.1 flavodoxin [Ruminococcus hominis]RKQ31754.1 flavodoxin [Ruminococcus sp. B05]TAP35992.1 flavodoxin [Mediterraneibacter sp. gm002]
MSKTAVVFWSGTGNTEEMANAVLEGMKENGADASIYSADAFQAGDVEGYDAIAFGCPAMGAEVLEEDEFQPLFDECKLALAGKKVALFGSYGWGDGEWMRNWEDDCREAGIELACDSVVCNDAPDEDAITACKELGAALA